MNGPVWSVSQLSAWDGSTKEDMEALEDATSALDPTVAEATEQWEPDDADYTEFMAWDSVVQYCLTIWKKAVIEAEKKRLSHMPPKAHRPPKGLLTILIYSVNKSKPCDIGLSGYYQSRYPVLDTARSSSL